MTQEQQDLVKKLTNWWKHRVNQIFVYSGSAGTGKTTIIEYFAEEMGLRKNDFICCALSGKAVSVLALHGLNAKTIHSLIYKVIYAPVYGEDGKPELNPNGDQKYRYQFVKRDKLESDYKLIVVDELSMVSDDLMEDIMSFNIPIIGMGDLNQLPPVFGSSSYMLHPNFILTKIMRQAENDPIVWLARRVLDGYPLQEGTFGQSEVRRTIDLDKRLYTDYDITICATNYTRDVFNHAIRRNIFHIRNDTPVIGDRVICRQNDWDRSSGGLYLTNGTTGTIMDIDEEHTDHIRYTIDFSPDYDPDDPFIGIELDRKYFDAPIGEKKLFGITKYLKFEYAYMITTHLSQGSQYPTVLFVDENFGSLDMHKKLRYTAITRAMKKITIILSPYFMHEWMYN